VLYRIVGEEIATHRHVEIPNWDAPDIMTAQRNAVEIGIVVSTVEPMDSTTEPARGGETAWDASSTKCNCDPVPEDDTAIGLEELQEATGESPSLTQVVAGSLMFLAVFGIFALHHFRPSGHTKHYELAQTRFSNCRVAVDESSLPEWKRRKIFCDLVAVLNLGFDDSVALTLVEREHDISEKTLRAIAKEGVARGWAVP
jgi:hypothetical protein